MLNQVLQSGMPGLDTFRAGKGKETKQERGRKSVVGKGNIFFFRFLDVPMPALCDLLVCQKLSAESFTSGAWLMESSIQCTAGF